MTRITRLQADNFKRLRAVEINPDDPNTVVITGNNAQGKSSVLDSIQAALAGRRGVKEITQPIRQGEDKARVVLELGDIRVERKWTPAGSQLVVGPVDGTAKFNSPQAILDKLVGALSFDPLEFAEAGPADQVNTLVGVLGLQEQLERIDRDRKSAYDERTEVNRELKRLTTEFDALHGQVPSSYDGTPPLDVSKLSIELEGAVEVERARATWQELEDKINELRARQATLAERAAAVVTNVTRRSSEEVRADLGRAQDHNKAADASARALQVGMDRAARGGMSDILTTKISQLDDEKRSLIANSKLPVEGLSFDEDGITLNGVPFAQASAAERLKVSVAMAMAMNPELRVICIRDASLLDRESFSTIVRMAVDHDYQVWYEVVGTDGEMGVVIEDGMVRDA